MCGVGNEDAFAFKVAAILMVFVDDQHASQLALGSGGWHQRDAGEARNFFQPLLQGVHQIQVSLHGVDWLEGVRVGETRQASRGFIDLWVVLHRA